MKTNFASRVQMVIQFSRDEAIRLGHDQIDLVHFLLGLVREGEGIACEILRNLAVDLQELKMIAEDSVEPGEASNIGNIPFTKESEKMLKMAYVEAEKYKSDIIGTEHLLLAITKEKESPAAQVLLSFDVTYDTVREELENILRGAVTHTESKQRAKTPVLDHFGIDITEKVKNSALTIFGRNNEINSIIQVLLRRIKCNPLIVGEHGVGKKAIVHGLAKALVQGDVPILLLGFRIIMIDLGSLVARTASQNKLSESVTAIINELSKSGDIILFIDELQTLVSSSLPQIVSNALISALDRTEFRCIGAATPKNYTTFVEKDLILSRNFQKINVEPPSAEQTLEILSTVRDQYEQHHRCKFSDEAIKKAVELSNLYLPDQYPPSNAINLLDEAGALVSFDILKERPKELSELEEAIDKVKQEKENVLKAQEFERASVLRDQEKRLSRKRDKILRSWRDSQGEFLATVSEEDIYVALSHISGIDVESLKNREKIPSPKEIGGVHHDIGGVPRFEELQTESILNGSSVSIIRGTSFVLIPHTEEAQSIYDEAIRPALQTNGLKPIKADDIYRPGSILNQVWQSILSAEVVVADVSGKNANVIYELGLCYGLKRCPILLVRDPKELPFNLRNLRYIEYKNNAKGIATLKTKLTATVEEFLAAVRA